MQQAPLFIEGARFTLFICSIILSFSLFSSKFFFFDFALTSDLPYFLLSSSLLPQDLLSFVLLRFFSTTFQSFLFLLLSLGHEQRARKSSGIIVYVSITNKQSSRSLAFYCQELNDDLLIVLNLFYSENQTTTYSTA